MGEGGGGSLEPWSPKFFCCGARSFFRCLEYSVLVNSGARSLKVAAMEPWSPDFLALEPWSPKTLWHPGFSRAQQTYRVYFGSLHACKGVDKSLIICFM